MKKMTTRAAWLHLAKAWDKAKGNKNGLFVASIGHQRYFGLCHCLNFLLNNGAIDLYQWREMRMVIYKQQRLPNTYCWKLNKAGACARAEFCLKQAAKLKKKRTAT
jgi:hypothetical protein